MWPATPGFAVSLLSDLERFRNEVDFLFGSGNRLAAGESSAFPPLTVEENGEEFIVRVFAPGFTASNFDITIQNTILTVKGTRREEDSTASNRGTLHRRERRFGEFTRVLTLPDSADPSLVQATYTHGVLSVTIGKRSEVRPRKIEIKAQ